jgi:hypothetical protein
LRRFIGYFIENGFRGIRLSLVYFKNSRNQGMLPVALLMLHVKE